MSEGVHTEAGGSPPGPALLRDLLPCDLVMKGGITSGVVYPKLIGRLAQRLPVQEHRGDFGGCDRGRGVRRRRAGPADRQEPEVVRGPWEAAR